MSAKARHVWSSSSSSHGEAENHLLKGEKSPEKWICLLSLLWKFPVSSEKVRNFMEFLDLSRQTLPVQHVFNVAFCMKCLYKSWHWVDLRQTRLRLEFTTGHCSCEKHCRPEIPPNGHGYPGKLWSLAVDPMISTLQPLRNRYNCYVTVTTALVRCVAWSNPTPTLSPWAFTKGRMDNRTWSRDLHQSFPTAFSCQKLDKNGHPKNDDTSDNIWAMVNTHG